MTLPIFVSATSGDLGEARDIVVGVLAGMGHHTRVQPTFPFVGGDLRHELRRLINECASVIQLVGFRCGQVPTAEDAKFGLISHTQYEALYAEQQGKRVMYITLPRSYPFTPCEPEADDLADLQCRYREAIRTRGDQRGTPGSPDALRVLIYQMRDDLAALMKLEEDRHREVMQGLATTPAAVGDYLIGAGLVVERPAPIPATVIGRDGAEMVLVAAGPFTYGSDLHNWLSLPCMVSPRSSSMSSRPPLLM
jgi:hypothetical protein